MMITNVYDATVPNVYKERKIPFPILCPEGAIQ
jgi:hypothetical protein